ncbi:MAG: hypothetical protein M0C28_36780 [Candidatus Moduliflexus flocculans]|nr:hypothetical protein [Candidatus Moduliflexus flocculans]
MRFTTGLIWLCAFRAITILNHRWNYISPYFYSFKEQFNLRPDDGQADQPADDHPQQRGQYGGPRHDHRQAVGCRASDHSSGYAFADRAPDAERFVHPPAQKDEQDNGFDQQCDLRKGNDGRTDVSEEPDTAIPIPRNNASRKMTAYNGTIGSLRA